MIARLILTLLLLGFPAISIAQPAEPLAEENLEDLLIEAETLTLQGHPIDARAKLQKALRLAPNDYRPHMMLGVYYLTEVGHFRLANQYLRQAEKLFLSVFDVSNALSAENQNTGMWQEHAKLLYLLAESRLNLDNYQAAIDTLDEFAKLYWDTWYPGTRAWILWKMGRTDEAIQVTQAGLLRGASPGKTYNILGILLSAKGNREMSLQAFGNAINTELALGSYGQVATPLNNSGEVYKELFMDGHAEASWVNALKYPDGCDHVLPSLNLAILYIESLRLFAAERTLENFESCFAANSVRQDTEHKALLALAKGRVKLKSGYVDAALKYLDVAVKSTQWFGKIGTNENDLKFAALIANAEALKAKAVLLKNDTFVPLKGKFKNFFKIKTLKIKAWWAGKRARELGIDELSNIEDLWIRHTDAMLEYPTFGRVLAGYPLGSLAKRLEALKKEDNRKVAWMYYELYFATALVSRGKTEQAKELLVSVINNFRKIDGLVFTEAKLQYLLALEKERGWFSKLDNENLELRKELFELLPSNLRQNGLALPVVANYAKNSDSEKLFDALTDKAFYPVENSKYKLDVLSAGESSYTLQLSNTESGIILASETSTINEENTSDWKRELTNKFLDKAFAHRLDPDYGSLVKLEILQ